MKTEKHKRVGWIDLVRLRSKDIKGGLYEHIYLCSRTRRPPPPRIYFKQKIEGGVLKACMFDDALLHLEKVEGLLEDIRVNTMCAKISEAIEAGLARINEDMIKRLNHVPDATKKIN